MKTFITGATGFVGREIAAQLHSAGHTPIILARDANSDSTQAFAARVGGSPRSGDILNPKSLEEGIAGADAVIHLVGIISEVGRNTFESVHALGTQNVVTAAQRAGVKRIIHMSALGTRPNAASRYHGSKWQGEEAVRNSGLDYTIFRPSLIYGPGDHFVNQFATMARWSPVLPVMGEGPFQPIRVNEVAYCFVRALTDPRAIGQTIDLVGPQTLTFSQILDEITRATHRSRAKLSIPPPAAGRLASVLEWLFQKFGKAPPLNHDQLTMLQEPNVGDSKAAEDIFGLKPVAFGKGLDWLKSN